MSLESKAIPLSDICEICIKVKENEVATTKQCLKCTSEFWVPLEEAQKLEKTLELSQSNFYKSEAELGQANHKIKAANKILDEYQARFPYAATTTIELVDRLRKCFSQEQKDYAPCRHGSSPNKCGSWANGNCLKTSSECSWLEDSSLANESTKEVPR